MHGRSRMNIHPRNPTMAERAGGYAKGKDSNLEKETARQAGYINYKERGGKARSTSLHFSRWAILPPIKKRRKKKCLNNIPSSHLLHFPLHRWQVDAAHNSRKPSPHQRGQLSGNARNAQKITPHAPLLPLTPAFFDPASFLTTP